MIMMGDAILMSSSHLYAGAFGAPEYDAPINPPPFSRLIFCGNNGEKSNKRKDWFRYFPLPPFSIGYSF
jgi:hypothetical protein